MCLTLPFESFDDNKTRQAFTQNQINEACYVDLRANKDVFESLRKNPKVEYDRKQYSYKAKYGHKEKSELFFNLYVGIQRALLFLT
ncbi:transcription initiation factor TFIIE, beta subunit, putative [Medicago truncatula]|uniref:Transcription initiation factor TFIIE, beta subunit, putative n=1 Tax=Medicago truncatula TaxID=3880 RepID=A0A072TFI4_MEDTR|nr:transcription initiation factor TFIIE, beta subunit, putative [Medicago truncatula]